jgi:hypothetical protein
VNPLPLIVLVVLNLPLFGLLSGIFFHQEGLAGALKYWFMPDLVSLFRGEYIDDQWAETKLLIYAIVCGLTLVSELSFLEAHFPGVYAYFIE